MACKKNIDVFITVTFVYYIIIILDLPTPRIISSMFVELLYWQVR